MFKRILLLSFAVLLIGASVSFAQTRIHSLPYTITSSGAYDIDTDLTSTGSGITVNADDVTIDLKGYSLVGSGSGYGIFIDHDNVEVRNGTVTNFSIGIYGDEGSYGTRIIDMRVTNNDSTGVVFDVGGMIRGSLIHENGGAGMDIVDGLVQGNTVYSNGSSGISGHGTILDNNVYSNAGYGISAVYSTIKNNRVRSNGQGGIYTLGGYDVVDGNTATGNTSFNISSCSTCSFGTNVAP